MTRNWAAVEELMRDLGSVRRAADSLRADDAARLAMDRAITEAAEAVDRTIDGPKNDEKLSTARRSIGVAMEVIIALDEEIGRSLRIRDQRIRFSTRRPSNYERIADVLSPLAEAGYTVRIAASSDAETWLVDVEKGGRSSSFRLARNAASPEWEDVVRALLP